MQKWKVDSSLHSCERKDGKKVIDYHTTYVEEFLNSDPVRDWESIERCKDLWFWSIPKTNNLSEDWQILDVGTKDGQFVEFLRHDDFKNVIGIDVSMDYVEYAQSLDRPVRYGDVCNLPDDWSGRFDYVFSHHVLGLTPDYHKALDEMWRVTKQGGYMITLNDCPGNPKKHYSLITDSIIFDNFTVDNKDVDILFNDYWSDKYPKEWVMMLRK